MNNFNFKRIRIIFSSLILVLIFSFFTFSNLVYGAAGVPMLINFQGRLMDSTGALLGTAGGTDYCYKFSIYDATTGGSKIWPSGAPSRDTITTRLGVFDATIGEADTLDLTFTDDQAFVDVQVATMVGPDCTDTGGAESFESLSPRPQIVSSGFAINSKTVGGFTPAQSATNSQIPVLTSGAIILGHATTAGLTSTGANPLAVDAGASGILNINGTSTGNIVFGGGSASTGCTLTNSSGAFACASTISSGVAGGTIGGFLLSGNTSGTISILPQAAAGTYNFNLPTTAGNSGEILTSAGGGASPMTWTAPGALAVRWNSLVDPTGTQTLAFGDGELNAWTVSSDTETFQTMTANSLTTGTLLSSSTTGLTTGKVLDLTLGSALTTGGALNITGASYNPGAGNTGNLINLAFTNASNSTSGVASVAGINIAPTASIAGSGGTHYTRGIYVQGITGTTGAGSQINIGLAIGNMGLSGTETAIGIDVSPQTTASTAVGIQVGSPTAGYGMTQAVSDLTSGTGIYINGSNSGALTAFTGKYLNTTSSRTLTSGSINDTGNYFNISRSSTANNTSGASAYTVSGDLATLSSNCTVSDGGAGGADTCTDTGNILELTQSYASASGAVLAISNSGSGADILGTSSTWNVTKAGAATFVGVNSGAGLLQGALGLTITGAAVNLNASSNFATNINTGTSTGTITLGGTAGNTMNIGTDNTVSDTINIGSALDNIAITSDSWSVTDAGALTVASCTGCSSTWNGISNPTGTQTLAFDDGELNAWTVSSDTETFHTITANSLTTGKVLSIASSSLTTGNLIDLQVSGTAAAASQTALNILTTGTNGTGGITTYGGQISNTHDGGTSTNVALQLTASGGTTANYALLTNGGNVGIGDTSPNSLFTVGSGDLFQINSTGQIGSQQAPVSDYLFALNGSNSNNYSRIIDIVQDSASNEDSSAIRIVNTANTGTIATTRSIYNIYTTLTPTAVASGGNSFDTAGQYNILSLNNSSIGATSNFNQIYGSAGTFQTSGSPTINSANTGNTINAYGVRGSTAIIPTLTSVAGTTVNSFGGEFIVTSSSSGNANLTNNSYGVYGESFGNLSTTGTTRHYGGYFAAYGTADDNYGLNVSLVSSATNNYGIYIGTVASAATNYAIYSNAAAKSYMAGSLGLGTTAPDRPLEVNSATGLGLRLTYNDADGSATNYADLQVGSAGELNILPSGFITNVGGGATRTAMRFLEPSGTGTDYAAIQSHSNVTTSYTWSLPAADSSGCVQSDGVGQLSIASCGGGLTVGTTAIASGTTSRILFEGAGNVLQQAAGLTWDNTDASLVLTTSSTTASNKALNVSQTGGTTGTDYAGYFSNTGTATTNVGIYATASGATTNLGLNVDAGQALIGGTTLTSGTLAKLNIVSSMASNGSTTAIAGIHGEFTINPTGGGTQVGNRFVMNNAPTSSANTSINQIIRTIDNTSLANTVRGIEIVSSAGSNTAGTNTGIRSTGATFGGQFITTGNAGGVSIPAAIYAENTGTTQGDIARFYTGSMTSGTDLAMVTLFHDTSTFTGDAIFINMADGAADDTKFTGNFLDFQERGIQRFLVTDQGITSMGLSGTASTNAVCSSLANATGPTAGVAYEIRDCNAAPAADYAEMYPVTEGIDFGDIVVTGTEMVNTYDTTDGNIDWTKLKGQITRLEKSTEAYQKNVIGIVVDNYGDFSSVGHNIKEEDNPMPVALNGRVPVKVSISSESIEAGDYLTTSADEPGKAMKATRAGIVIGKAIAPWSIGMNGNTVMVYVEQGYFNGESVSEFAGLDMLGDGEDEAVAILNKFLEEQANNTEGGNLNISEILTDRIAAGLEVITPKLVASIVNTGTLNVSKDATFSGLVFFGNEGELPSKVTFDSEVEFSLPPIFNKDTAGFAVVKEGDRSVRVEFAEPYVMTPVVTASMTFEATDNIDETNAEDLFAENITSLVIDKDEEGFTILLNKNAPQNIRFSWIALGVKDAEIFESLGDGLEITGGSDEGSGEEPSPETNGGGNSGGGGEEPSPSGDDGVEGDEPAPEPTPEEEAPEEEPQPEADQPTDEAPESTPEPEEDPVSEPTL